MTVNISTGCGAPVEFIGIVACSTIFNEFLFMVGCAASGIFFLCESITPRGTEQNEKEDTKNVFYQNKKILKRSFKFIIYPKNIFWRETDHFYKYRHKKESFHFFLLP